MGNFVKKQPKLQQQIPFSKPQTAINKSNNDQINKNQPTEEDVPIMFGLQVRVKKAFFDDGEIQFLKTIDKKIEELGYEKILYNPQNEQILSELFEMFNKNKMNRQEGGISNKERTEKRQQGEEQNHQKEAASDWLNHQQRNNEKKQKDDNQELQINDNDQSNMQKQNKPFKGAKITNNIINQKKTNNQNNNSPQVSQIQFQITPNKFFIPDNQRYSRVSGWFFMDHTQEILTPHSLRILSNEQTSWNFLFKLWKLSEDSQSKMEPAAQLEKLGLTNKKLKQEMNMLKALEKNTPQDLRDLKISFSDNPSAFLLSKTPLNSVSFSTYTSQVAIYSPFDFRVIFTECDGYDKFRAITFGLFFNILAFKLLLTDPIFYLIENNEIPFSIRITLYHILCMKVQNKITEKEIAHNLIYIFKCNQMTKDILMTLISLFSQTNISSEIDINLLAQNTLHIITYQQISQSNSEVITCQPKQGQQPVCGLFLDFTPQECGVNLFFEKENYQSCQEAYQTLSILKIPTI